VRRRGVEDTARISLDTGQEKHPENGDLHETGEGCGVVVLVT
jgi:hypothetical protein